MFEFAVVAGRSPISVKEEARILDSYGERSLLPESDRLSTLEMFDRKALLLARSRYDRQGDPVFSENGRFTCLNGYIISKEFGGSAGIVEQLHGLLLRSSERSWLDEGLGEFQIVHYDGESVEFICSKAMTYPLYWREGAEGVVVSSRATLANVLFSEAPRLDVRGQIENIVYNSLSEERTAFEEVKCLPAGKEAKLVRGRRPELVFTRSGELWAAPGTETPSMEEALEQVKPLTEWFTEHLALIPGQLRLDEGMTFGLSGGKDSRLMLASFVESGLLDHYENVQTRGDETDPEVEAATPIARHYDLQHRVLPRNRSSGKLFTKLPLHIFQTEGEVNPHGLGGNYARSKSVTFTGLGAEVFKNPHAGAENIGTFGEARSYIQNNLPFDPVGFVAPEAIQSMRDEALEDLESSAGWGVEPQNFMNWFYMMRRLPRWAGKNTSTASLTGLSSNPFCAAPLLSFAHNMGAANRQRELMHFAMLAALNGDIIQYPFAKQEWHADIRKAFSGRYSFPDGAIKTKEPAGRRLTPWTPLYQSNDRQTIKRIVADLAHPDLEDYVDHDRLMRHIDRVEYPSRRAMLSIFGLLSSNLLLHAGDVSAEGVSRMQGVLSVVEKNSENPARYSEYFAPKESEHEEEPSAGLSRQELERKLRNNQRQVRKLKARSAEEKQRAQRMERQKQRLGRQLQAMQNSRAWKALSVLRRLKARILNG